MMRPSRLWAVARRDLALELRGRRGWVLPVLTAGLLAPASSASFSGVIGKTATVQVTGDVPAAVAALPDVKVDPNTGSMLFTRDADGVPRVHARDVPKDIRAALDGPEPQIVVEDTRPTWTPPGRSLLLALISSSLLTGALAESLPGERGRKTLEALLAAAITRGELVGGKWLAWAGYGALSSTAAALIAILAGRQTAGPWLLTIPLVPAATVAVGLYMVRRSADVVGGATVTLRVLPAVLSIAALISFVLGIEHPLLGAALPLGGALLAAGAAWPGLLPPIVAATSTTLATVALLYATVRDLSTEPIGSAREAAPGWRGPLAVVAASWWAPIAGPLLWTLAGNPAIAAATSRASGVLAAGTLVLVAAGIGAASSADASAVLGVRRGKPAAWLAALVVGLALAGVDRLPLGLPLTRGWADAAAWLGSAVTPTGHGVVAFVIAVLAQEIALRGWLRAHGGRIVAAVATVVVLFPLDPVRGVIVALALGGLVEASEGSLGPALLARLVWGLAALA